MDGVRRQRDTDRRTLVLNATPTIYICKAGLAGWLGELKPFFRLMTTTAVYEEVYVRGMDKGVAESGALKEIFDGGVVEVVPAGRGQRRAKGLSRAAGTHPGEASVISLALTMGATAVTDDRRARQVARALGVRLSGMPWLIIELVRRQKISKGEAKLAVEKMVDEGWYCSAKLFASIMKTIDDL